MPWKNIFNDQLYLFTLIMEVNFKKCTISLKLMASLTFSHLLTLLSIMGLLNVDMLTLFKLV